MQVFSERTLEGWQRSAQLWHRRGQIDRSLLLSGTALSVAQSWAEKHIGDLEPYEHAFLKSSKEDESALEKVNSLLSAAKRNKRLISGVSLSVIVLLAIVAFSAYKLRKIHTESQQLEQKMVDAREQFERSEVARVEAEQKAKDATIDAQQAEQGSGRRRNGQGRGLKRPRARQKRPRARQKKLRARQKKPGRRRKKLRARQKKLGATQKKLKTPLRRKKVMQYRVRKI